MHPGYPVQRDACSEPPACSRCRPQSSQACQVCCCTHAHWLVCSPTHSVTCIASWHACTMKDSCMQAAKVFRNQHGLNSAAASTNEFLIAPHDSPSFHPGAVSGLMLCMMMYMMFNRIVVGTSLLTGWSFGGHLWQLHHSPCYFRDTCSRCCCIGPKLTV